MYTDNDSPEPIFSMSFEQEGGWALGRCRQSNGGNAFGVHFGKKVKNGSAPVFYARHSDAPVFGIHVL
jgi:hypothetical protein